MEIVKEIMLRQLNETLMSFRKIKCHNGHSLRFYMFSRQVLHIRYAKLGKKKVLATAIFYTRLECKSKFAALCSKAEFCDSTRNVNKTLVK